ncbi:bifunctional lysylphosphatidylglycerol flippase/synthetase MprF [Hydrocarboniphaga effusa]|uniref:bifunctional lysylphosphatidylglycerol flippase/synthetase MprF n=1 Tax=Hydrocarboniphaga effusa TaxID=243629 RepID=UPI0031380973
MSPVSEKSPLRRIAAIAGPLMALVFLGIAVWLLDDGLGREGYVQIGSAIRLLPIGTILLAVLVAAVAYAVLILYDVLALAFVGRRLRLSQVVPASLLGYALGNNIGYTLIAGASVRYWVYRSYGFGAGLVAAIATFCSLGFVLGCVWVGGAAFTLWPLPLPGWLPLPWSTTRPLGFALLALLACYVTLAASGKVRVRVRGVQLALPSLQLTLGQLGVATLDLLTMSATLWILLPSPLPFDEFLSMFMLALAAGVVSQVPGGLGVFETVLLMQLRDRLPVSSVVAALVVFRLLYYVLPLALAATWLAVRVLRNGSAGWNASATLTGRTRNLVPQLLALATFAAGTVLLFSGATPAALGRLAMLHRFLPHPLIELSDFLASLVGVVLLLLARGLQRRVDAAYVLVALLLGVGIVMSLAKGLDYEEALVLAGVLIALLAARKRFNRRASIFDTPLSRSWVISIASVLIGSLALWYFAFRQGHYAQQSWWEFALRAEAPRALRATVGAAVVAVAVAVARLLRPMPEVAPLPGPEVIARAGRIAQLAVSTHGYLALRGDKALLFSDDGRAFLMYGRQGRSWIAMGDPVGPRSKGRELLWRFRDLVDRYDGWPVIFEARAFWLPVYRELGLVATPLGEEARVDLRSFSLNGATFKTLRQAHASLPAQGCCFDILPAAAVPALIPELARVSESWLSTKNTREKGFSNASFDAAYLAQFPLAVVRHRGTIVGFANLWCGKGKYELSVDLMRHAADAPPRTMDLLFTELMLWGQRESYQWFNFGMAPLSGFGHDATVWSKVGAFLYRHGEHFYNFQGLRQYKAKFRPSWVPLYLASPGGVALPAIILDVTALMAGGVMGILRK